MACRRTRFDQTGYRMEQQIVELAAKLTEIAVRNAASIIADKIRVAKARTKASDTIAELEEIVSSLINDKNEVVQIAQAFQQELVAQRISESDIAYVTSNLIPVIEKLAEASDESDGSTQEMIEVLTPLLSEQTFTVLQLLGFNFKQAVGEPLTALIRELIIVNAPSARSEVALVKEQQALEFMRLVQDPAALARFHAISSDDTPAD